MARAFVCHGKDCRKARGWAGLVGAVGEHQAVRCQKICEGPVAGLLIDGRLEWFERLKGARSWRALLEALATGEASARLWSRRVKKRRGRLRS